MARTKQTARMRNGGKAPRMQLATRAAKKPEQEVQEEREKRQELEQKLKEMTERKEYYKKRKHLYRKQAEELRNENQELLTYRLFGTDDEDDEDVAPIAKKPKPST